MNNRELGEQVHIRANGGPEHFHEITFTIGTARCAADWVLALIRDALLRGEAVTLKELGTFKVVKRSARRYDWSEIAIDNRAGSDVPIVTRKIIPAHRTVVFTPAGPLKKMPLKGTP